MGAQDVGRFAATRQKEMKIWGRTGKKKGCVCLEGDVLHGGMRAEELSLTLQSRCV